MTSGAGFNASKAQEDGAAPYEQQAFPTGHSAMFWSWTNQLANARKATGQDVVMLRPPSFTGKAADNGLFLKASMFWSIAAMSKAQQAAGTFVNFLLNSPEAAKIQQLNRGVPSSKAALQAMDADLSDTDRYIVTWLDEAGSEITLGAPAIQPQGTADSQNSIARALQEVRFDRQSPPRPPSSSPPRSRAWSGAERDPGGPVQSLPDAAPRETRAGRTERLRLA